MPPAQKGSAGAAVAASNNVSASLTITPALPAHAVGDVLLCYTACRLGTATVATPSGWTQLGNVSGTNGRLALFGKIAASSSETAPGCAWSGLTTGTSAGTPPQAQCAVFTGTLLEVDVIGAVENISASTTLAAAGGTITTLTNNALVLTCSVRSDDLGTWSMPAGFTRIGDALTTSGADQSFGWAYQVKAAPGSITPADFSVPSGVGVNSSGFQIALKAVVAQTYFGVVSMPMTFNSVIDGDVVIPAVTHYGSLVMPMAFATTVNGRRKTFSQLSLPITFEKDVSGQRKTFGQLLSPFIFGKSVAGQKKTFGQVAMPISVGISTDGYRAGLTLYGALSLPVIFGKDVRGQRKTFGQVTMPLIFSKQVQGQRKTFGQVVFPIIFTKEAVGRKNVFGQLSMQTLFGKETAGQRKTFSQLAMPITFSKDVVGRRKTFGQVILPVSFIAFVNGQSFVGPKTYYGQLALPLAFNKQVTAYRKTFGQVTAPFIFGSASQGRRKTFGQLILPLEFESMIESGRIGTYGQISLPIIVDIEVDGKVKARGVILNYAEMIYLGAQPVVAVYTEGQKVWPIT